MQPIPQADMHKSLEKSPSGMQANWWSWNFSLPPRVQNLNLGTKVCDLVNLDGIYSHRPPIFFCEGTDHMSGVYPSTRIYAQFSCSLSTGEEMQAIERTGELVLTENSPMEISFHEFRSLWRIISSDFRFLIHPIWTFRSLFQLPFPLLQIKPVILFAPFHTDFFTLKSPNKICSCSLFSVCQ